MSRVIVHEEYSLFPSPRFDIALLKLRSKQGKCARLVLTKNVRKFFDLTMFENFLTSNSTPQLSSPCSDQRPRNIGFHSPTILSMFRPGAADSRLFSVEFTNNINNIRVEVFHFYFANASSTGRLAQLLRHRYRCRRSGSNETQCRQQLAIAATFLRSCVVQALRRGVEPCNSLHASTKYRE